MAKKTILVSDISGQEIEDGNEVALEVLEYPGLSEAVRLDASKTETDRLKIEAKPMALLRLVNSDGSDERIAVDAELFAHAVRGDIDYVLAQAESLHIEPQRPEPSRRGRRPRGEGAPTPPRGDKPNYTSVEWAGSVKRGIISDGEKQTVRDHFDEVNENLAARSMRQLDLNNIEHVERYGLQALAEERGITPTAQ